MIARRIRTEILVESAPSLASDIAHMIVQHHDVVEIVPPRTGLVMNQVRESAFGSIFYLGEALITEARVRIEDALGVGAVLGDKPALAHDLAVIDAYFSLVSQQDESEESTILKTIISQLEQAREALLKKRESQFKTISTTRVDFQTMAGDTGHDVEDFS